MTNVLAVARLEVYESGYYAADVMASAARTRPAQGGLGYLEDISQIPKQHLLGFLTGCFVASRLQIAADMLARRALHPAKTAQNLELRLYEMASSGLVKTSGLFDPSKVPTACSSGLAIPALPQAALSGRVGISRSKARAEFSGPKTALNICDRHRLSALTRE